MMLVHISDSVTYYIKENLEGYPILQDGKEGVFRIRSIDFPEEELDIAAWFWKRLEPHFDHRSGDIGAIVDGRLAQAFAKDCEPDKAVAWSGVEPADELAFGTWTKTRTGLCVSAACSHTR